MYCWCFTLFFILPFTVGQETCGFKDSDIIKSCYNSTFFSPNRFSTNSTQLRDEIITMFKDSDKLTDICQARDALISCINKNDTTIINRCFNVDAAEHFFGDDDPNKGRRYMTNYYQLDYICDSQNSWALQKTYCVTSALDGCKFFYSNNTCNQNDNYFACISNTTNAFCNAAMACYAQKFATFQTCYDMADCADTCNSLSPTVNNIVTLCNNDTSVNNIDNITTPTVAPLKCSSNQNNFTFAFLVLTFLVVLNFI